MRTCLALSASAICVAALSACGGGGDGAVATATPAATPPSAPAATTLRGTVAVGAPITSGKLKILDANGAIVASDVTIDANGQYANITLTGPAPYRLEACGFAGPNYTCVYSVASAAGTANVSSLTTATVLLATGQAPGSLMNGTAPTLTTETVATAQTQLQTSLASVLSAAGVGSNLNFISADLSAGSRSGYDGVLDAIGVNIGKDANAFVQITPRLGQGNLYLEQGQTTGTVSKVVSAESLQMSGLETLFQNMSQALASSAACTATSTGIARSLATSVQMSLGDGEPAQGVAQVAAGLCGFFGSGDDGNSPMWGARFLSPTLGRCDVSGAAPVCAISFVLQSAEGSVQPVGSGMAVTKEAGVWKFKGDLLPIQIQASARAQRTKRIDSTTPVYGYDRALAFEVPALNGLACAKVSQRTADGTSNTIGLYKRHPGAAEQHRLSLWTTNGVSWSPSMDPASGSTRSADDTWIALPEGATGDAVVRNFYRAGRSVNIALYSDAACSAPFVVAGHSDFDIEIDGVPPVWASMPAMPWPELDAATEAGLRALNIGGGATGTFQAAWTFPHGPLGLNGATMCGDRGNCGEGGSSRIGTASLRPGSLGATITLRNPGDAIAADAGKSLALYGGSPDGVGMQSNYSSCPTVGAGEGCH